MRKGRTGSEKELQEQQQLSQPEKLKQRKSTSDIIDVDGISNNNFDNDQKGTKHFHCYLLRSLDPRHPNMTYVGFTTDPNRRLRQHNGNLKHGGAWKTRRSGRPWEFTAIIYGFDSQKRGLQFEWAWQHCDKSLAVRAVLGDEYARSLKRKYSIRGQLTILKTLVMRCPDIYDGRNNQMTVYFFDRKFHSMWERINVHGNQQTTSNPYESTMEPRENEQESAVQVKLVESIQDMPFFSDRSSSRRAHRESKTKTGRKRNTNRKDFQQVEDVLPIIQTDSFNSKRRIECMWCHRLINNNENSMVCSSCGKQMHDVCGDLYISNFDNGEKPTCPECMEYLEWEENYSFLLSDDYTDNSMPHRKQECINNSMSMKDNFDILSNASSDDSDSIVTVVDTIESKEELFVRHNMSVMIENPRDKREIDVLSDRIKNPDFDDEQHDSCSSSSIVYPMPCDDQEEYQEQKIINAANSDSDSNSYDDDDDDDDGDDGGANNRVLSCSYASGSSHTSSSNSQLLEETRTFQNMSLSEASASTIENKDLSIIYIDSSEEEETSFAVSLTPEKKIETTNFSGHQGAEIIDICSP